MTPASIKRYDGVILFYSLLNIKSKLFPFLRLVFAFVRSN